MSRNRDNFDDLAHLLGRSANIPRRRQPRVEEPGEVSPRLSPIAPRRPLSGFGERIGQSTPKPAKVSRRVTVDRNGMQTVSEDLEESTLEHDRKVIKNRLKTEREMHKTDVFGSLRGKELDLTEKQRQRSHEQHMYEKQLESERRLGELNAANLTAKLNADVRGKELEIGKAKTLRELEHREKLAGLEHDVLLKKHDLESKQRKYELDAQTALWTQRLANQNKQDALEHERYLKDRIIASNGARPSKS